MLSLLLLLSLLSVLLCCLASTRDALHLDPANTPPDFKSYKGHHVLLFGDSYFTSIVGPNGSGKSNSYVQCPQSPRVVWPLLVV